MGRKMRENDGKGLIANGWIEMAMAEVGDSGEAKESLGVQERSKI